MPNIFTRLGQWFKHNRFVIAWFLGFNVLVLFIGSIMVYYDGPRNIPYIDNMEKVAWGFAATRLMLEIIVLLFYRQSIAWLRNVFKLGHRLTWYLLRCHHIFKLIVICDWVIHIAMIGPGVL